MQTRSGLQIRYGIKEIPESTRGSFGYWKRDERGKKSPTRLRL